MAYFSTTFTSNQTSSEVIPASPNQIIVIRRIVFSVESSGTVTFLTAPGQPGEAQILPPFYLIAYGLADINLGREVGVSTGRGEAFGISSALIGASKGQGLMIWYEYVD